MDITELFCFVDDFCKYFEPLWKKQLIETRIRKRNRPGKMSFSEMMTILILFHNSRMKTFKDFYLRVICRYHHSEFPNLLIYDRFIALTPRCFVPIIALFLATAGKCSGVSFIDSTRLKVCDNRRIHKYRTFRGIAKRGNSSMGWFFTCVSSSRI